MKKILLSFALLLAGIAVNGQTVSKLMKKYKNEPGVELINIDKNMMKLELTFLKLMAKDQLKQLYKEEMT